MKNILNNLALAAFLAFVSQGIQAQFDDIYYDPSQFEKPEIREKDIDKKYYRVEDIEDNTYEADENSYAYHYDDDYSEWEEQDYYYSSRIKRFHRPYAYFDYYGGCYVNNYFYDPYDFDPFFYDRDIYVSAYGYHDYYHWRRFQLRPWYYNSYWNHWDWYWGWSSFPFTFTYNYWPNHCYSGYYYNNWPYYNNHHHYNYNYGNDNWNRHDKNEKGNYYGSRRFGLTNTSKRGPVRITNSSPKVFVETEGIPNKTLPERTAPKRIERSADGDIYKPAPERIPEREIKRRETVPERIPSKPESDKIPPRYTPRDHQESKPTPQESRPEPRKDLKPERVDKSMPSEEIKKEFKPERIQREDNRKSRPPEMKFEMPKERSYQPQRESRPEPRMDRHLNSGDHSRSSSESRGSSSKGSGEGRKSPR